MTIYAGNPPDSPGALNSALSAYIARPWYQTHSELLFFLAALALILIVAWLGYRMKNRAKPRALERLNTPINRAGFALLVICFGAFAVALLMAIADGEGGRLFARVLDPDARLYDTYEYLARYSIGGMVVGAWLAWAYQPTLGRLVRWIRNG